MKKKQRARAVQNLREAQQQARVDLSKACRDSNINEHELMLSIHLCLIVMGEHIAETISGPLALEYPNPAAAVQEYLVYLFSLPPSEEFPALLALAQNTDKEKE